MPWPVDVTALEDAAAGARLWRGPRSRHLTVMVKTLLSLVPDGVATVQPGAVIATKDRHYRDSPRRSMEEGNDLAPFRPRCDVTVQGHAHAPPGQPLPRHAVRLAIVKTAPLLDKRILVVGDRADESAQPAPFQRIELDWEHAYGGKAHKQNPVGRGADKQGNQSQPPNVVDPSDARRPAGFAPVSRYWGDRTRILGATPRPSVDADEPTVPDGFDWGYFQAAPIDQQIGYLAGDEWIVLDGMHPALPRMSCQLPGIRGAALVYLHDRGAYGPATPLTMVADTLAIDADRMSASLVWRGSMVLTAAHDPARMRVVAAVQVGGAPIPWPSPRDLAPPDASREPAAPAKKVADETLPLSSGAQQQRSAATPFSPSPEARTPQAEPIRTPDPSAGQTLALSPSAPKDPPPPSAPIAPSPQARPVPPAPPSAPAAPAPPPAAPPVAQAPKKSLDETFRLSRRAIEEAAASPAVPFKAADSDAPPPAPPSMGGIRDESTELGGTISLRPDEAINLLEAVAPFPIARPKRRPERREGVPRRESPQIPIVNKTALTAATSAWQLAPPKDVVSVVVKGTFDLVDGPAELRQECDPLSGDVYLDDEPDKSLLYPSDFAVLKPRADVLLVGHAVAAPGATASQVVFQVAEGHAPTGFKRAIAIVGDRRWSAGVPGEPEPFERVPLVWERAFGGADVPGNPAGTGRAGAPPPNLEDPTRLLRTNAETPPPACFGPISPMWHERRARLGTFDDAWFETRWPYFPKDFDPLHFQSAPAAQQLRHLRGDETYEIAGVGAPLRGALPGLRVRAFRLTTEEAGAELSEISLALDTAVFDANERKVNLVWRGLFEATEDEAPEVETLFIHTEPIDSAPATLDRIKRLLWQAASPGDTEEEAVEEEPFPALDAEALAAARADVVAVLAAGGTFDEQDLAGTDLSGLDFSGRSLVGVNLKGAILRGCRFVEANLAYAVLAGADFADADLSRANLQGVDLVGAILERATLDGANLNDADLSMAKAEHASFREVFGEDVQLAKAALEKTRFDRAQLPGVDLTESKLDGAVFEEADLTEVKLYYASGEGVRFDRAKLGQARADDADLVKSNFNGVKAAYSVFEKAYLAGSSFLGAELEGASFCRASCEGVNYGAADALEARFCRAKLKSARFLKTNLFGADFERADLTDADLRAANLHGAETWKAKLRGAKLDQAILTQTKLAARPAGRTGA